MSEKRQVGLERETAKRQRLTNIAERIEDSCAQLIKAATRRHQSRFAREIVEQCEAVLEGEQLGDETDFLSRIDKALEEVQQRLERPAHPISQQWLTKYGMLGLGMHPVVVEPLVQAMPQADMANLIKYTRDSINASFPNAVKEKEAFSLGPRVIIEDPQGTYRVYESWRVGGNEIKLVHGDARNLRSQFFIAYRNLGSPYDSVELTIQKKKADWKWKRTLNTIHGDDVREGTTSHPYDLIDYVIDSLVDQRGFTREFALE